MSSAMDRPIGKTILAGKLNLEGYDEYLGNAGESVKSNTGVCFLRLRLIRNQDNPIIL